MEETNALCTICGVDMLPRTAVSWYRPRMPVNEAVFSPYLWTCEHRANGMHWHCFDAHHSVLGACDAGKEPHATADCCHDRAVHSKRIEDVRKKPEESWDVYFARCDPPSRFNVDGREELKALVDGRSGEAS